MVLTVTRQTEPSPITQSLHVPSETTTATGGPTQGEVLSRRSCGPAIPSVPGLPDDAPSTPSLVLSAGLGLHRIARTSPVVDPAIPFLDHGV